MISSRLTAFRNKLNKTQQDMADYLGITRPAYTAYESGSRNPDYKTLEKIADLFDTSIDYLLGRTDDPSPPSKEKINPNINIAYLDGVKHELTPEVAKRLKEDIELFEKLKEQWKKEQEKK
ncbi:helix-turn-helix domain-containing protein [Paenibacillus tyrfis]|uniref:HTH cro/C1-type domain-containing protein n=1 Tax=Paenibacillus tyrfis TaxID=1501230 RepID=A0A081NWM6_9BACL|nr:helix-turn-helix transcriptional regulator [Paenibacillus tyrfis]KEQ22849.1 hypothetical protein ET33_21095 [Paenibacillus tyrfis]